MVSGSGATSSLFDGEFGGGNGVVAGAGTQANGREPRLVGGIGKVLGFQAKGRALRVSDTTLADSLVVEEVASVKLDAGLSGPNFHDARGRGLKASRAEIFSMAHGHEHDKRVIVASARCEMIV